MGGHLNFEVKWAEITGRARPYNPRGRVVMTTAPWSRGMLLLIGAVMITSFTLAWMAL